MRLSPGRHEWRKKGRPIPRSGDQKVKAPGVVPDEDRVMRRQVVAALAAAAAAIMLLPSAASSSPTADAAPVDLTPPTISGTPQVGKKLTVRKGRWQGPSLQYAYSWLRCNSTGGNCAAFGVVKSTYVLVPSDAGMTMRVAVTAWNGRGSTVATTAATAVIAGGPPTTVTGTAPTNTSPPTISGSINEGQSLIAGPGSWTGSTPLSYSYQWQQCDAVGAFCAPISSAVGPAYVIAASDDGKTLRVSVTASNSAGSAMATSAATGVVPQPASFPPVTPPSNSSAPAISGTPLQGQTLSGTDGAWSGTGPLTYSYQWQRCNSSGTSCVAVASATGATYTLGSADVGSTMRFSVTVSNSAGSATASSAATAVVAGPPANTTPPSISGTPQPGQTLTATVGGWAGTAPLTYSYQWQRCNLSGASCVPITSASGTTYVLASADVGSTIRVSVTARNSVGSSTVNSAAMTIVAAPVSAPAPAGASPFFVGDLETGTFSQWDHVYDPNPSSANPPKVVTSPSAQGGFAAKLTADPNDSYLTGTGNTSSRVDVYENARPELAHEGLDEWVHMYVMFPAWTGTSGYKPTNGEWNWWHQWHASDAFSNESVTGGQPVALGVVTGGALTQCGGDTSSSANPQIFGYIAGGDLAKGTTGQTRFCTHQLLKYDHWYDMYEHIIWSKSASTGYYALYLDGALVAEFHQPTLFYNSATGAVDVPNVELDNYRWNMNGAVNWSSTIYFDGVKIGPTQASVN